MEPCSSSDSESTDYSESEHRPLTDSGNTNKGNDPPMPIPAIPISKKIPIYPVKKIFLIYTTLTFMFAFVGGVIFRICEFQYENEQIIRKKHLYSKILNALPSETLDQKKEYESTLDLLIHQYADVPLDIKNNRWSLSRSTFFAFTTATTIGYGYSTPQTASGKAATFLYGFPAICIFGLAMIEIGRAIVNRVDEGKDTLSKISRYCVSNSNEQCNVLFSKELKRTLIIFMTLMLIIAVSACLLTFIERDWSFWDGCYFMWISLSTIGYGEVEPVVVQSSFIANGVIWIGLSVAAILIGSTQNYVQMKYLMRNVEHEYDTVPSLQQIKQIKIIPTTPTTKKKTIQTEDDIECKVVTSEYSVL